jgi:hypothetical protein
MLQHQRVGTVVPGLAVPERPEKDDARELGGGAGFGDQRNLDSGDFRCCSISPQAAMTIEGEAYARAYLDRLRADAVRPGELAVLLSFLSGEMLNGACRLIEKALRGGRHA